MTLALMICGTAAAQPTMTSISPNYGGVGSNSPGTWTITGSGFSTAPKATRFLDINGVDLFTSVSCSSTTSCTGNGVFGNRLAAGSIATISIFARVGGLTSGSFAPFIYYGPPTVSSVSPSSGPSSGTSPITINGSAFTSGASFPGMTSIYLQSNISDRASGCVSTTQCTNYSAPALSVGVKTGPNNISLRTPGGDASPVFTYTPALSTPTITSVSPSRGTSQGGTSVTITGTNFLTAANATTFTFATTGNSQQIAGVCASTTSCTVTTPPGYGSAYITAFTQNSTSFSGNSTSNARFTYAGLSVGWPDGRAISNPGNTYLNTSENGAQIQYTLALTTQPSSNVTLALSATTNGGVRGTVSPTSMTFTPTNWFAPQTVTVTGLNDTGAGGTPAPASGSFGFNVIVTTSSSDTSYSGLTSQMNFNNLDNETAGYRYSRNSDMITTKSGGTVTTEVVLLKAPTSTVTMNFVSTNPLAGTVSPASMTFDTSSGGGTSWNTPRTLTITGANDGIAGNTPYAIIVTASTADAAYTSLGHPPDIYVTNGLPTPTTIVATATSASSVSVSWSSVAGADSYLLYRCPSTTACTPLGPQLSTSFTDTSVSAGVAYLYKVRGVASDIASLASNPDIATTIVFTDDPLIANVTPIKAVHLTQMRTAADAVHTLAGLSLGAWTDISPAGVKVKAVHITELRATLNFARTSLGLSPATFTNALTSNITPVMALDFTEVRNAVK
jgi:hypothetical protein